MRTHIHLLADARYTPVCGHMQQYADTYTAVCGHIQQYKYSAATLMQAAMTPDPGVTALYLCICDLMYMCPHTATADLGITAGIMPLPLPRY
jgi:hypothetical protein